jgi:hypothetical protein
MTDPRTVIKDIRGIPHPPMEITDVINTFLAKYMEQNRMNDLYQSQVAIVREREFREEQKRMEEQMAKQREANMARILPAQLALKAKKERQEQIAKERLKNLKKARKAKNG